MTKRIFLLFCLIAGLGWTTLYAQRPLGLKPPIKWGDLSREHLAMDHYAPDTNATVVILADYGDVYFRNDYAVVFERHTRIKILSEAGYDWGTVSIPYRAEKGTQRVRSVKGQTFTLGPDGKAVRHKMDKKSIFNEDIDGEWKRIRFTLPALEPGAVIEYSYEVESDSPVYLPDWTFQWSEPTLWSEYRVEIPLRYNYVKTIIGRHRFAVEESEEIKLARVMRLRWAMQDVPALREEPFMTTLEDYRAAIEFQLSGYLSSVGWIDYRSTWEEVAKELMGNPWFGKQIKPSRTIKQRVEVLTEGLHDPVEKMEAIYDFVRTAITWNQEHGVLADQSLKDVLKTHSASSPEITLLLVSMLRAAHLEAHPVLISTRSHGRVLEVYPMLSQFNATLAAVELGSEIYLLDATDPLRPYTLLPTQALNGRGWLVREMNPTWIPINVTGRYQHKMFLDAALDASGTLTATLQASDDGYSALRKRHQLKEADIPEAFVANVLLDGLEEVLVDSCAVTNEEVVSERLKTEAVFSTPGYAQVAGDFIYFNPMPIGRLEENPLRLPERTFPVDLAYPRTLSYTLRLKLPEGYAVQDTPQNVRVKVPSGDAQFQRLVDVQDGVMTVQTQFVIKRSIFASRHYASLRLFYEQVVAAGAEQVVLKRVAASNDDAKGGPDR